MSWLTGLAPRVFRIPFSVQPNIYLPISLPARTSLPGPAPLHPRERGGGRKRESGRESERDPGSLALYTGSAASRPRPVFIFVTLRPGDEKASIPRFHGNQIKCIHAGLCWRGCTRHPRCRSADWTTEEFPRSTAERKGN